MKFSGYRLLMLWVALIALACPLPTRAQATKAVAPDAEMQSGMQSFRKGDFTQALQHWTAAASAYEAAGNAEGQGARARARRRGRVEPRAQPGCDRHAAEGADACRAHRQRAAHARGGEQPRQRLCDERARRGRGARLACERRSRPEGGRCANRRAVAQQPRQPVRHAGPLRRRRPHVQAGHRRRRPRGQQEHRNTRLGKPGARALRRGAVPRNDAAAFGRGR